MIGRIFGMRALLIVVTAALLSLVLATSALAADPGKGTIKGTLTNKTASGGSVANVDVTLGTYQGSNDAGKKTVKTDKDGKFVFDGLETAADYTYQVTATYQGAPYYSDPVNFSGAVPGQPGAATPQPQPQATTEQTVQVMVFDATNDQSVLKSTAHHYLIEPDKTGVTVSEIVIISNTSDKSFTGVKESHAGTNSVLRFTLPEGAQNFEPVDGLFPTRVLQIEGGFVDTTPVYPGMSQRVWRYSFPANADAVSFTSKLTMASDKVSVLARDNGAKVSVAGLTGPNNQDIQGDKYLLFSGQNIPTGTDLQFKVEGLSQVKSPAPAAAAASAAAPATSQVSPLFAGAAVGIVLAVIAAVVLISRRQKTARRRAVEELVDEEASEDDELASGDLEAERRQLIATIARLDDLFEQDKIGSEEYGRIRTDKKRRLIEVVKLQKTAVVAGEDR